MREVDALAHARRMLDEGADVIDIGGESSRPKGGAYGMGAEPVSAAEEARRVVPLVRAVTRELRARVSVDTVKAEVAARAVEAGATIVNDVSCGASEELLRVVATARAELVLMHTRGRGEVIASQTRYVDVVDEVRQELLSALERAYAVGVPRERIWIDPGIGFAKTADQSLALLAHIDALVATGQRVLVGPSRKAFIADAAPALDGSKPPPSDRLGGTAAAVTAAVLGGAHAVRVHDVAIGRQAALVAERVRRARC